MRIPNLFFLICTLVPLAFANNVWAAKAQGEPAVLEQCSAYSQAEMHVCLEKKSAESNETLRHAEKLAFSALSKWDEDVKFINLAKAKLKASSKAHEQYRAAQCAFVSSLGGGAIGNALELRRLSCVVQLNVERAKRLDNESANLPLK